MSRFVPLDQVTAEAMTVIGDADNKDRLIFRQWVYRALREIGVGKQNVEVCNLYPKDLSMQKPDDCTSIIDIALFDVNNNEMLYKYHSGASRIHQNRNTYAADGTYSPSVGSIIDLSEDDYYIHLGSNASEVAYAKIRYFKFPVDEDGLPKIPEDQVFAITMFIRYMWSMRKNDNRSEIDQNRYTWLSEKAAAKARSKMPSMLEGKQIAKTWMSMISKPFFDNF